MMNTKYLPLLLTALITLTLFSSCSRDKKEEVAPSKTKLLVAHEWQGDRVLMMGIDVTESGAIPQDVPDVRTLRLAFKEDQTYIAQSEDITFEGEWRFNEDETKIYFDFLGLGEVDVKNLTDDNLDLSTSVSKNQLSLLAQLLNLNVNLLNRLPDGSRVETEIRFVKP
jgi:hypothetical protein